MAQPVTTRERFLCEVRTRTMHQLSVSKCLLGVTMSVIERDRASPRTVENPAFMCPRVMLSECLTRA